MTVQGQFPLFEESAEAGKAVAARDTQGRDGPQDGWSPETAISVSRLNAAARTVLEAQFGALWVAGEIANWRRAESGHRYFSLRDESAQLSCVMFRSDAQRLPMDPEEGMEVRAFGRVSLYEGRGRFQLLVQTLEAKGEGLWRLAFDRLRRALSEEGLLAPERKRALPRIPWTVGVVSSRSGAAVRDVIAVIRRRAPWTHVLVSDCRVQGEGSVDDICRALDRAARWGVDVIVLTRGGGSVEDLWSFNEEQVARAVAGCPVPIVSAVGHEVDVTITDLVADVRAPTPSAAGELVVPERAALQAWLDGLADGLISGLRDRVAREGQRSRLAEERLFGVARRRLEAWGSRLRHLAGRLDALSPLGTLGRGYAVPLDEGGRVLRNLDMFKEDMPFGLRVVDGLVQCTVEGVSSDVEMGRER